MYFLPDKTQGPVDWFNGKGNIDTSLASDERSKGI